MGPQPGAFVLECNPPYDDDLETPDVINIKAIFHSDQKGCRSHFRRLKQWSGSPSEVPPNVSLTARARVGTLKADAVFDTGAQVTDECFFLQATWMSSAAQRSSISEWCRRHRLEADRSSQDGVDFGCAEVCVSSMGH